MSSILIFVGEKMGPPFNFFVKIVVKVKEHYHEILQAFFIWVNLKNSHDKRLNAEKSWV